MEEYRIPRALCTENFLQTNAALKGTSLFGLELMGSTKQI